MDIGERRTRAKARAKENEMEERIGSRGAGMTRMISPAHSRKMEERASLSTSKDSAGSEMRW